MNAGPILFCGDFCRVILWNCSEFGSLWYIVDQDGDPIDSFRTPDEANAAAEEIEDSI